MGRELKLSKTGLYPPRPHAKQIRGKSTVLRAQEFNIVRQLADFQCCIKRFARVDVALLFSWQSLALTCLRNTAKICFPGLHMNINPICACQRWYSPSSISLGKASSMLWRSVTSRSLFALARVGIQTQATGFLRKPSPRKAVILRGHYMIIPLQYNTLIVLYFMCIHLTAKAS